MRSLKGLLLTLSIIGLVRCAVKDEVMIPQFTNDDLPTIVGEWTVKTTALQLSVKGQPLLDYLTGTGMSSSEAQNNVDIVKNQTHWEGLFESFDFKSDGKWSVKTNNETASGVGTWKITDDQKELTISPANADQDMVASIFELTNSNLQFGIILESQPKFGTTVDYLVLVKATRP